MKHDIITIGSAMLDVLLKSDHFTVAPVDDQLMVCEIYGGKMDVEEAIMCSGGAATNTAVSFARQGFRVGSVAEIGVDVAAQIIWDDLKREGVDTQFLVQNQSERTALSSILVAKDGSRSAMTFRGGAHHLHEKDIDFTGLTHVRAIHLSNVGDIELIKKIHAFCRENRIFLSWNPSKSEAEEFFLRQQAGEGICDALFLNDQEWEAVSKSEARIFRAARMLVITRGKKGGEVVIDGKHTSYTVNDSKVIDETGAGDAFAAGFVGAHLRGASLDEALSFAGENAASVVGYLGAKEGLLRI